MTQHTLECPIRHAFNVRLKVLTVAEQITTHKCLLDGYWMTKVFISTLLEKHWRHW